MTQLEKMEYIRRCHDEVVTDICETRFGDLDNTTPPHTSQIITDFKVEAVLYEYMTEEEFDALYSEYDRMATAVSCAWC